MIQIRNDILWRFLTLALSLCIGALLVLAPQPTWGAETVGKVAKQRADAYGTPPGESRSRKFPRYEVVSGELIETSGGAAILLKMTDDTELFLGERASLVIDEFVYDPSGGSSGAVYNFSVGTLRFVSGQMAAEGVSIVTPMAHIGLRGSEAIIFVTPDGGTTINVIEGTFSVRSREFGGAPPVEVNPDQSVTVNPGSPISAITKGIHLPEDYSHEIEDKVPDYSDDLIDLTVGGAFEAAKDGKVTGSAGHHDDHDDHDHGDGH